MKKKQSLLISEIQSILEQLDIESLSFIKEQADVLLYNKGIRERNSNKTESSTVKNQPEADTARKSPTRKVSFEQIKNGKFFNLCIGNEKIFMDYKEVKALLKIAESSDSPEEGSSRLYRWFERERKDVLNDGSIGGASHPLLRLIFNELLETFE